MVSSTLCPAVHILGSQNLYGRAEGIADHYWPWAVFSSFFTPLVSFLRRLFRGNQFAFPLRDSAVDHGGNGLRGLVVAVFHLLTGSLLSTSLLLSLLLFLLSLLLLWRCGYCCRCRRCFCCCPCCCYCCCQCLLPTPRGCCCCFCFSFLLLLLLSLLLLLFILLL